MNRDKNSDHPDEHTGNGQVDDHGRRLIENESAVKAPDSSESHEASTLSFTDDFTLTPPLGTNTMRLYRIRVLNE